MNSFINVLILILTFPILILAIYSGLDIAFDSLGMTGSEIPFQQEIFLGFGIVLFLIFLRRSSRRWMAVSLVNKIDRFKWNQKVSDSRRKRVLTYNLMESLVMISLGIGLFMLNSKTIVPTCVFLLFSLDNIIFSLISKNKYRVGLSSKAIMVADREIILIYFIGLRKITIQQQTVYFDYIDDLQLSFPVNCIDTSNQAQFFQMLESVIDKDRVFMNNIQQKMKN